MPNGRNKCQKDKQGTWIFYALMGKRFTSNGIFNFFTNLTQSACPVKVTVAKNKMSE